MAVTPFHLLNRAERAWLGALADGALREWRKRWLRAQAPRAPDALCHAADTVGDGAGPEAGWLSLNADGGWRIAIAAPPCLLDELGAALVLPDEAPLRRRTRPSPLLRGMARAALSDLVRMLLAAMPGQPAPPDRDAAADAPPAHCRRPGSGAAVIELSLAGLDCAVTIGGEVVLAALATRPGVPGLRGGLASRAACLAPLRLMPRLVAGEAALSINELQTMMAGDVIKLDASLEQPFALRNAAGIRLCGGYLGLLDGRKGIRLTR